MRLEYTIVHIDTGAVRVLKEIKCECGHVNPIGTVFVKLAGNHLKAMKIQNYWICAMRECTEISHADKTIIDKIWSFFFCKSGCMANRNNFSCISDRNYFSARNVHNSGIAPAEYYKQEYGFLGQLYYQLGFNNLYGSWWYMILIASIGISLVICSLDRVIPLYKALKSKA